MNEKMVKKAGEKKQERIYLIKRRKEDMDAFTLKENSEDIKYIYLKKKCKHLYFFLLCFKKFHPNIKKKMVSFGTE